MIDGDSIELERLRQLEPLSSLSDERLNELISLADVEKVGVGVCLFREGDIDNQSVYLLKGDVQLSNADESIDTLVSARSEAARFPLDAKQPRQVSAVAMTNVELIRFDNTVLDYLLTWDELTAVDAQQATTTVVTQPALVAAGTTASGAARARSLAPSADGSEGGGAWLHRLRHVMAFRHVPPANVAPLLERMTAVKVKAGDVVLRQGDPGNHFYVLTDGQARVTRVVELATLEPGASFGEESLISGAARNATVTMESDGTLMRLAKDDFEELLKEPLVHGVAPDQAQVLVSTGAIWLDVRQAREFHHNHLPGAINIPLHELRSRVSELQPRQRYICYCQTGQRSSAAAFILSQHGIKASVLRGGLQVLPTMVTSAQ